MSRLGTAGRTLDDLIEAADFDLDAAVQDAANGDALDPECFKPTSQLR